MSQVSDDVVSTSSTSADESLAHLVSHLRPVLLYRLDAAEPVLEEAPVPTTPAQLAAFVGRYLDIRVPLAGICPCHQSPLEYLVQSFFHQRDLIVWANRGGGKTMAAAAATMLDIIFRSPVQARVLGGSFDQSDRLGAYIRDMLDRQHHLLAGKSTQKRIRLASGGDIRMLAQSQRAVRGLHVQKIRCDELDLFAPAVWRAVQFSTRSEGRTRGSIEVLSTLNRRGGLMDSVLKAHRQQGNTLAGYNLVSWCIWDVIEKCQHRDCDCCPLADDCQGKARNADGFFRIDDAIAIKARSSRATWDSEILCRRALRDRLVLSEFSKARHVRPMDRQRNWPTYRAIDFGYVDPMVCLWIQVGPDGQVLVYKEYSASLKSLVANAMRILDMDDGPVKATYCDPAGNARQSTTGKACTEMLAEMGMPCTSRGSTIGEGVELIRTALAPASGEPRLCIHPRCEKLVDAFKNYHYPDADDTTGHDQPVKDGPDHFIDALRYFFINRLRPRRKTASDRY